MNVQRLREKCNTNKNPCHDPMATNSKDYIDDFFTPGPNRESYRTASTKTTKIIHNKCKAVF